MNDKQWVNVTPPNGNLRTLMDSLDRVSASLGFPLDNPPDGWTVEIVDARKATKGKKPKPAPLPPLPDPEPERTFEDPTPTRDKGKGDSDAGD